MLSPREMEGKMNIKIIFDTEMPTNLTGGEFTSVDTNIFIDSNLDIRTQRELVTHAIIESYCPSWEHSKVDELGELIQEGIDQLGE